MNRCTTHGYFVGAHCPACEADDGPAQDWSAYNKADLVELAEEFEVELPSRAKVADIIAALEAAGVTANDDGE